MLEAAQFLATIPIGALATTPVYSHGLKDAHPAAAQNPPATFIISIKGPPI